MAKLEFGPVYAQMEPFIGPVEMAKQTEEWSYDSFWVPDYVHRPCFEALTALAAAAPVTKRIKLGSAVMVLPYKHPVMMAKTALSIDVLSQGRLILGVGLGGTRPEFDSFGLDFKDRAAMSDEAMEIISQLFTGEEVSHQGRFHQFDGLQLGPASVQKPVPMWVGAGWNDGVAPGAIRRTGRYGNGFVPVGIPPDGYAQAKEQIAREAESYGRDPSGFEWALFLWVCVDDSIEAAREVVDKEMLRRFGRTQSAESLQGLACGTPADCIQVIEEYAEVGVTHFVLDAICPPSDMLRQYEIMAKEIVPRFR